MSLARKCNLITHNMRISRPPVLALVVQRPIPGLTRDGTLGQ
jgi:hypothetical protein